MNQTHLRWKGSLQHVFNVCTKIIINIEFLKFSTSGTHVAQCGTWFDSIAMPVTLSMPQDKLIRLMRTLQQCVDLPKMSLKEMMELLGYWEFCATLLPLFMRAFSYTAHSFKTLLSKQGKHNKRWLPKAVRRDFKTIMQLLPEVNLVGLIGEWKLCNQFLIPQVLVLWFLLSV